MAPLAAVTEQSMTVVPQAAPPPQRACSPHALGGEGLGSSVSGQDVLQQGEPGCLSYMSLVQSGLKFHVLSPHMNII